MISIRLSSSNKAKERRYWSVKIETPTTSLFERHCHNVVNICLNYLTVIEVDFYNCPNLGKQFH